MKEAAYKAYTQQNEIRFYAPKKFKCIIMSEEEGLVFFKDQIFYTSSIVTQSYIFTTASLDKETKAYTKFVIPEVIDKAIKSKLADVTTLSVTGIKQKKSKFVSK